MNGSHTLTMNGIVHALRGLRNTTVQVVTHDDMNLIVSAKGVRALPLYVHAKTFSLKHAQVKRRLEWRFDGTTITSYMYSGVDTHKVIVDYGKVKSFCDLRLKLSQQVLKSLTCVAYTVPLRNRERYAYTDSVIDGDEPSVEPTVTNGVDTVVCPTCKRRFKAAEMEKHKCKKKAKALTLVQFAVTTAKKVLESRFTFDERGVTRVAGVRGAADADSGITDRVFRRSWAVNESFRKDPQVSNYIFSLVREAWNTGVKLRSQKVVTMLTEAKTNQGLPLFSARQIILDPKQLVIDFQNQMHEHEKRGIKNHSFVCWQCKQTNLVEDNNVAVNSIVKCTQPGCEMEVRVPPVGYPRSYSIICDACDNEMQVEASVPPTATCACSKCRQPVNIKARLKHNEDENDDENDENDNEDEDNDSEDDESE